MPARGPHKSMKRRQSSRSPQKRVLVVCEGKYTEPRYFAALSDHLRLHTLVIKATEGVDPRTLVDIASKERQREEHHGEQFDFVYCVFDRDSHPQFDEATDVAQAHGLKLARSWPCFEFWLLLHFEFTRAPYGPKGRVSPCDVCVRDLREHLPNYSKGDPLTFDSLCDRLEQAIANGRKARADAKATGEDNPSTEVHELVVHLRALSGHS